MGETLPFFAWRIQRAFEYNPLGKKPAKRLQDYLCENFWITTSGNFSDQALITTLLTVGADRILFATDYPYEMATDAARWNRKGSHQRERPPKDMLQEFRSALPPGR
jgi:predicted TIM-barrel fold metal-dependent hydrolase